VGRVKNLMLYVSQSKSFDEETSALIKIQIDNSIEMDWAVQDILLFTNFDYEYNGVYSISVPDHLFYELDPSSNKVRVLLHLLKNNVLDEDELYWYHDFDAYENSSVKKVESELDGFDFALCPYLYKDEWQLGSFFFRASAVDIFEHLHNRIVARNKGFRADEKEFLNMVRYGEIDSNRYKVLNITYNITMRYTAFTYPKANKPLKILHFHPYYYDNRLPDPVLDNFMYGKSKRLKTPLMSERLIRMFQGHGIT
jgi:hypothetical protein